MVLPLPLSLVTQTGARTNPRLGVGGTDVTVYWSINAGSGRTSLVPKTLNGLSVRGFPVKSFPVSNPLLQTSQIEIEANDVGVTGGVRESEIGFGFYKTT